MKYYVQPDYQWEENPVKPIFEKQQEQGKYNRLETFGGKTYNYIEPINYVKKGLCAKNWV